MKKKKKTETEINKIFNILAGNKGIKKKLCIIYIRIY